MKKQIFLISMLVIFAAEIAALAAFVSDDSDFLRDAVKMNEAVHSVQEDWDRMETHINKTELDYTVLDKNGKLVFCTRRGLNESVNSAAAHGDTILDLEVQGGIVGKIIIYNDSVRILKEQKQTAAAIMAAAILLQCAVCAGYMAYLNRRIIRPFRKLEGFAERVAGGNLDIPLEMDRENLFGAFTESFDLMRSELKKARLAEAKANESKKELVAKLSHDIKTPVASIKAVSEVGMALTGNEKDRGNYVQIISKADQIDSLVTNLFTATLEELQKLAVTPADMESREIEKILKGADYLNRGIFSDIPDCLLYADGLRLQQVFDNIFMNSYKYADTEIKVSVTKEEGYLAVGIEDYGGGAVSDELPLLKEKFRRGSNAKHKEGAGLGLYLSDYFMKEMRGGLSVENGRRGLRVTVRIRLSGRI